MRIAFWLFMKKHNSPLILAIDTSCDDTSAAVTCGQIVLSNVVASQTQLHKQYGGVFPTVAKQAHRENIEPVIKAALKKAGGLALSDLDAIAVTQGPGLAPALEIGIEKAKQLATQLQIPLIPVNHIEGHVLSSLVTTAKKPIPEIQLPALALVISGGHTDFILVKNIGEYERLGFSVDDAAGEALDKFGRMIDLGYPAGPVIEEFARKGDPQRYHFPLPMTTSGNFNMSFSGMKTAALTLVEKLTHESCEKSTNTLAPHQLSQQDIYDLAASFQTAVFRAIAYKLNKLLQAQFSTDPQNRIRAIWLGGGVASNIALRAAIRTTIKPYHLKLHLPYTKRLCIDNAAMIGVAAGFRLQREGLEKVGVSPHDIERRPRWELGNT